MQFSMFPLHTLVCNNRIRKYPNGDGEIRTHDPLLARQVLSQLSYTPMAHINVLKEIFNFHGLKWTRTTDLTLSRRAL